jgi:hypothetical protein
MDSHFDDLLRGHLGRLFKNERMSIADFQQWFMTAWWEAEEGASESLYSFGSSIEHLLYIWSSGEWSDAAFLQQLQRTARNYYRSEFVERVAPGMAPPHDVVPVSVASLNLTGETPVKLITTGSTGSVFVMVLDRLVGDNVIRRGSSPAQIHQEQLRQVQVVS